MSTSLLMAVQDLQMETDKLWVERDVGRIGDLIVDAEDMLQSLLNIAINAWIENFDEHQAQSSKSRRCPISVLQADKYAMNISTSCWEVWGRQGFD
jgi:succinate dehydrogenase/fumarate reductase-like Fe-S protein